MTYYSNDQKAHYVSKAHAFNMLNFEMNSRKRKNTGGSLDRRPCMEEEDSILHEKDKEINYLNSALYEATEKINRMEQELQALTAQFSQMRLAN